PRAASIDAPGWYAIRRDVARSRRARRNARLDRARFPRRYWIAARRAGGAATATRAVAGGSGEWRGGTRGRGRASLRHAAQWRSARAGRSAARGHENEPQLSALCAARHRATEARPHARAGRRGGRDRDRGLGAPDRRLRSLCCGGAAAALDRYGLA